MNAKKMHEHISELESEVKLCQEAVIESNKKTKALGFAVTFGLTSVCIALFWLR